MTIQVQTTYKVSSDDIVSGQDQAVFELSGTGAPKLVISGLANMTVLQHDRTLSAIVTDASVAAANIGINEGGALLVEGAGDRTVVFGGQFSGATSLNNQGSVVVHAVADATGFLFNVAGTLTNSGTITVISSEGNAVGVAGQVEVHNLGVIQAQGLSSVIGIEGALNNEGVVRVTERGDVIAVNLTGDLLNTGSIVAGGQTSASVAVHVVTPHGASFDNQGSIIALGSGSVGIELGSGQTGVQTFHNEGLVRAWFAFHAIGDEASDTAITLVNSGTMRGMVGLGAADDTLTNSGLIRGETDLGAGDDTLTETGKGVIRGQVFGQAGDDAMTGGKHADLLFGDFAVTGGQDGNDTLTGGKGADTLLGGGGVDHFAYASVHDSTAAHADLIMDLHDGDLIDLSAIDADTHAAGDQAFFFVGSFDGRAGEATLTYDSSADRTALMLDNDGDGAADAVIIMLGDHTGFTGFIE